VPLIETHVVPLEQTLPAVVHFGAQKPVLPDAIRHAPFDPQSEEAPQDMVQ
jgi:hypothetical protein